LSAFSDPAFAAIIFILAGFAFELLLASPFSTLSANISMAPPMPTNDYLRY